MAFYDVSREEQAQKTARGKALEGSVSGAFLSGLKDEIDHRQKVKEIKEQRSLKIIGLQQELALKGLSLPEGSEADFKLAIDTGDWSVVQPHLNKVGIQQRDIAEKERKDKITQEANLLSTKREESQRNVRRNLIKDRKYTDKNIEPFERMYGGINQLEEKYNADPKSLTGQDRILLLKSLVPLVEINPGVVRQEEIGLVQSQQSTLNRIMGKVQRESDGTDITNGMVNDMLGAVSTLQPVVRNMKLDSISNIKQEVDYEGLQDQDEIILGKKNKLFLQDPNTFAQFGKRVKKETPPPIMSQMPGKSNEAVAGDLLEQVKALSRAQKIEAARALGGP